MAPVVNIGVLVFFVFYLDYDIFIGNIVICNNTSHFVVEKIVVVINYASSYLDW